MNKPFELKDAHGVYFSASINDVNNIQITCVTNKNDESSSVLSLHYSRLLAEWLLKNSKSTIECVDGSGPLTSKLEELKVVMDLFERVGKEVAEYGGGEVHDTHKILMISYMKKLNEIINE